MPRTPSSSDENTDSSLFSFESVKDSEKKLPKTVSGDTEKSECKSEATPAQKTEPKPTAEAKASEALNLASTTSMMKKLTINTNRFSLTIDVGMGPPAGHSHLQAKSSSNKVNLYVRRLKTNKHDPREPLFTRPRKSVQFATENQVITYAPGSPVCKTTS